MKGADAIAKDADLLSKTALGAIQFSSQKLTSALFSSRLVRVFIYLSSGSRLDEWGFLSEASGRAQLRITNESAKTNGFQGSFIGVSAG